VCSIRVSADAGLSWKPEFPLPHWDKMNLPAARNAVRNTLTRSAMHGRWFLNDPDCILLRASTRLTPAELRGILTVQAMCGGPVIVSDDMKVSSKALTLVGLDLSSDLRPSPSPCRAVPGRRGSSTPRRSRCCSEITIQKTSRVRARERDA